MPPVVLWGVDTLISEKMIRTGSGGLMVRNGMLRTVALGGVLALPGATAMGQDDHRVVLRDVEVVVSEDQRLVLHASDGQTYELAGLRALRECEGAAGMWACGEASRQVLQSAVAGEMLDCAILENGDRPAVECMAQTRNLNLWMLRGAGVELLEGWAEREAFARYKNADRAGDATRDLARALAEADPLGIGSRRSELRPGAALPERRFGDDGPWRVGSARGSVPLARATRRGATAEERRVIGAGLVADSLRAGVWELGGGFRVIVGEDPESCLQYIWCTFAVVDAVGRVVLSGTARGAPRVGVLEGVAFDRRRDPVVLVWEEPGGAWQEWVH